MKDKTRHHHPTAQIVEGMDPPFAERRLGRDALGTVLGAVAGRLPPFRRLKERLRRPGDAQRALLRRLLARAKETEWGRTHGFRDILRARDIARAYSEAVPLGDYARIAGAVSRLRAGERDILWPGPVLHFAVSGGTASSGRVIPVTADMLRRMSRAALAPGLWLVGRTRSAGFLSGKVLSLPGGVRQDGDRPGTLIGEVSALMAHAAPAWLARRFQALPPSVMLIEDWNEKLDRAVEIAAGQDVRAIIMVPSWAPLLFERLLSRAGLARPQASGGGSPVSSVWPHLSVFFSGGVALSSYRPLLERYLGPGVTFLESYSASEGFFAFQDDASSSDLLVHLDSGVFFEFVPVEDLGAPAPRRFTVDEVESGRTYALYVSTCAGLWAYAIDDLVRFTSTDPPRLRVVGRTKEVLDRYGEAVYADDIAAVIGAADRLTGALCAYVHVTYAEAREDLPGHEWFLEFEREPVDVLRYAAALDDGLGRRNRHYAIRRIPGAVAMAPPHVTLMPRGTVVRALRERRPGLSAQGKLLVLSEGGETASVLRRILSAGPAA